MELLPKSETIALREKYLSPSCDLFFRKDPLKIVRGKGQYMYDELGNAYLDCINNVAHVGHCHPTVVKAGCEQMALISTNNRFLHDNIVLCAKRLIATMPSNLSVCFFVNSGSEANDLALRLAQIHTGNTDIITLDGAYHGHLTSTIDISPYKLNMPGGPPKKDFVHIAPLPDSYRGKYRDSTYGEDEIGHLYAEDVKDICKNIQDKGKGVCAFIAESLLSCGGQIIPPKNYFREVYQHVRAAGGICIADEVQVGFGRVGDHWWAFQTHGDDVIPDIVTLGKPMGNGHPVSAVITTRAIAESFKKTGVGYFNTFGGNPVSCAIANAVLDVIEEENLKQNALEVGTYLKNACEKLRLQHKVIGDVRGAGLFVGVELVTDQIQRLPAKEIATYVVSRMKEERVLLSSDGPEENVIKFKPPMVFSKENVDTVMLLLNRVLLEVKDIPNLCGVEKSTDLITGKGPLSIKKQVNEQVKCI
ncbi:hypothetical protein PPYR_04565 [Photinus pyralis]|uniref:Alanine--glyoxylate aminotransferase 2-like n=1 Tax=Photinus pyralis TaxID=7054 RepID=A0A1Y1KIK8_PHOPY|nr:alanine--glyoxylate aminotransferase 2-like [Photinus pyralis]KAB0802379.1 hypothetical protein PPYR_04565 [Photinus pyralis]